jgi:hypothetical protein
MDQEPLDDDTRAALRLLVFELRQTTRARVFPARIHVGVPGGDVYVAPADDPDHGLRVDLLLTLIAMHHEDARPAVWLTRVGEPLEHDLDLAWQGAAVAAFGESKSPLPWFAVVTKQGWRRPATDETRTWLRLRLRGRTRPDD